MFDYKFVTVGIAVWSIYCLIHIWQKVFSSHGIPKSIPWPDNKSDFWSRGKSTLRSFLGSQGIIEEGYQKYSKINKPFILPNLVFGPEVILPPSQIQWLLDQPDHELNQTEANKALVSGDVTFLHPDIINNRIHTPIIENEMSKKQDTFADEQIDEIQYAFDLKWGNDPNQWKEIPVFETIGDLMTRLIARTYVGLPLCRNEKYLHSAHTFNSKVPLISTLELLSVPILRPLMVRLAHAYDMMHYRKVRAIVLPMIKERIPSFLSRYADEKQPKTKRLEDFGPNDFIQWALKYSFADDSFDPKTTPELVAKQLTVMSFAATHSTALTLSNIVFDIASYPDSARLQNILREEIIQVISQSRKEYPGAKDFGRVNLLKMIRLDSALRESMRLWGFSSRGVQKVVLAPEGVYLPSGERIPKGVKIGVSGWPLHRDDTWYKKALSYNPFRFCDRTNTAEIENLYGEGKFPAGGASMTSTGDRYLVFSHGRWSCPGRFFAQNNLKRIIAQILLNYEIEPLQERPKNMWFNHLIGPPMVETIRVRRRKPEV